MNTTRFFGFLSFSFFFSFFSLGGGGGGRGEGGGGGSLLMNCFLCFGEIKMDLTLKKSNIL